ncbi:MAG: hypothetical protein FWC41_06595 [Firmicutes bacterium]|nr:hypothetical protein [Bacillota bacterium]
MKKILILLLLVIATNNVYSQGIAPEINTLINKEFESGKGIKIEKIKLFSSDLEKVFAIDIYFAKTKIYDTTEYGTSESSTGDDKIFGIKDSKIVVSVEPSSADNLGEFVPYIKKDFILKTYKDAQIFEVAIDMLFPAWDPYKKQIIQKGNKWFFIRADFFDDKSGYEVKVDGNSKITSIEHKLRLDI